MRRFESCLYCPTGFSRELKPVTNGELQHLSIDLLNKTSSTKWLPGDTEVFAEEVSKVSYKEEFHFVETLYRVLIPANDNMFAETASKMSIAGSGFERIRNATIKRVMEYDSTVKLWDATKRLHPLHQQLPHTIFYGDNYQYFNELRRLGIPFDLKSARKEVRNTLQKLHGATAADLLEKWDHNKLLRERMLKILRIASYVTPKTAVSSKNIDKLTRHSLKTKLLADLESNAYNMGLFINSEDSDFRDVIRFFQEPTERLIPLAFVTTYKTSLYATCPKALAPANLLDGDDGKDRNAALEMNFVVQNLVTAWPRKYDKIHDFDHKTPLKDVLPMSLDINKLMVKRSDTLWAKLIREEEVGFPNADEFDFNWSGNRGITETPIEKSGLRVRKNANSMIEDV